MGMHGVTWSAVNWCDCCPAGTQWRSLKVTRMLLVHLQCGHFKMCNQNTLMVNSSSLSDEFEGTFPAIVRRDHIHF